MGDAIKRLGDARATSLFTNDDVDNTMPSSRPHHPASLRQSCSPVELRGRCGARHAHAASERAAATASELKRSRSPRTIASRSSAEPCWRAHTTLRAQAVCADSPNTSTYEAFELNGRPTYQFSPRCQLQPVRAPCRPEPACSAAPRKGKAQQVLVRYGTGRSGRREGWCVDLVDAVSLLTGSAPRTRLVSGGRPRTQRGSPCSMAAAA